MKISVLSTGTNNVPPIIDPLRDLGHELTVTVYDAMDAREQLGFPALVDAQKPDWVLYVGALPGHHHKPVPGVETLAGIGGNHLMVHLCFDGAEPYWWATLEDYYANGRFALQVNIDGVRTGPIGDRGFTTLCPVDATKFRNPPWSDRSILCGFSGGLHANTDRGMIMGPLVDRGLVLHRHRDQDDNGSYDLYRRFLESCRVGINFAGTGGGIGGNHVKHRAGGELPAAGCLVLETVGSPLCNWYTLGEDYLEYRNIEEAAAKIEWVRGHAVEAEAMARRMRAKTMERHSPAVFWSQVMERLGLVEALYPAPEVAHKAWGHDPHLGSQLRSVLGVPQQISDRGPFNVVGYGGHFFVVPKALGPLDLTSVRDRSKPGILMYGTLQEAMLAVAGHNNGRTAEAARHIVARPEPPPRPITPRPNGSLPRLRTGAQRRGAIG